MPPRAAAPAPLADGQGYSHRSDGKKLAGWPPRLLAPKTFLATPVCAFDIRDGQIIRIEFYFDHAKALEAAGLQE